MGMQSATTVPQLGELLRYWRQERGKSQLDLSLDTGISQRHLSFVESRGSAPSRGFLSAVSDALSTPLRERNTLLLASGFAPQYGEQSIDAGQMAVVTRAIDRMLEQHAPPALVLDRYWNAIRPNTTAPRFSVGDSGAIRAGAHKNGAGLFGARTNEVLRRTDPPAATRRPADRPWVKR